MNATWTVRVSVVEPDGSTIDTGTYGPFPSSDSAMRWIDSIDTDVPHTRYLVSRVDAPFAPSPAMGVTV